MTDHRQIIKTCEVRTRFITRGFLISKIFNFTHTPYGVVIIDRDAHMCSRITRVTLQTFKVFEYKCMVLDCTSVRRSRAHLYMLLASLATSLVRKWIPTFDAAQLF